MPSAMRPALSIMLPTPVSTRTPPRSRRARSPHPVHPNLPPPSVGARMQVHGHPRLHDPVSHSSPQRYTARPARTHDNDTEDTTEPMMFEMSPVVSHRRIEIPDEDDRPAPIRAPGPPGPPPPPPLAKFKAVLADRSASASKLHAQPRPIRASAPLAPAGMLQLHRNPTGTCAPEAPVDIISWRDATAASSAGSTTSFHSTKGPGPVDNGSPAHRQPFRYPLPRINKLNPIPAPVYPHPQPSTSRLTANVHLLPSDGDPDGDVPELVHPMSCTTCIQCVPGSSGDHITADWVTVNGPQGPTRRRRSTPDNFTRELEALEEVRRLQEQRARAHAHGHARGHGPESSSEDDSLVTPQFGDDDDDEGSASFKDRLTGSGSGSGTLSGGSNGHDLARHPRPRTHSPLSNVGATRGRNRSARPLARVPPHTQMSRLDLESPGTSFVGGGDASDDDGHASNALRLDRGRRRRSDRV